MKIDAKLREGLSRVNPADKRYFDGSEYLTIAGDGEDNWVGKIVETPLTADGVDDVKRNVISILTRILTDVRIPREVSIFAAVDDLTQRDLSSVTYHGRQAERAAGDDYDD
jgi:hypothetical protein